MKVTATVLALCGLFASSLANPVPETQLSKRGADIDGLFASVTARIDAAVALCADVDITADIDIRAKVAASLKADLDACADLLAKATADIKASVKADVVAANGGCDGSCMEKKVVKHSEDFCKKVDTIVKHVGEDCAKDYIKPCLSNFGKLTACLNGIFIGIGASVAASIKAILGVSLSAVLGLDLDLDLDLGIGTIIKIGRAF